MGNRNALQIWRNVVWAPATITVNRNGRFGAVLDLVLGHKVVPNPHPYAGYFVTVAEDGSSAVSRDGIAWGATHK